MAQNHYEKYLNKQESEKYQRRSRTPARGLY